MPSLHGNRQGTQILSRLTPPMQSALALLLQAHDTAANMRHDARQFAIELHVLAKEAQVGPSGLRALLCQGFAEHLVEQTGPRSRRRSFRKLTSLRLHAASCFVLTESGLAQAR